MNPRTQAKKKHRTIAAWIITQCLVAFLLSGIFWFLGNAKIALAGLIGGLIGCISHSAFLGCFFSVPGFARHSKKMLNAFYVAEGLKVFFATASLALSLFYLQMPFLPLLAAYFVVHIGFLLLASVGDIF